MHPRPTAETDIEHVVLHMVGCEECSRILWHLPPDLYARTRIEEADMRHVVGHMLADGCPYFYEMTGRLPHLVSYVPVSKPYPVPDEARHFQGEQSDEADLLHIMGHLRACPTCTVIMSRNSDALDTLAAPMTVVDTSDEVSARGRPPKEGTVTSMLRFEVPAETAEAIRSLARASGQEMMPFLARTICQALNLPVPVPRKPGPTPKGAQAS